nr:hypothetical protein [uncultured Desulfobulbus sp.]
MSQIFKIKLNVWRRLYIVLSVLYFFPVLFMGIDKFPSDSSYYKPEFETIEDCVKVVRSHKPDPGHPSLLDLSPKGISLEKYLHDNALEICKEKVENEKNEKKKIENKLLHDIRIHIVLFLSLWIVPVLIVYILGMATAWIYHGFNEN